MAIARAIKRRIKTAKNISQVTRALEMVSAVKMRRAQASAMAGRVYMSELERIVRILSGRKDVEGHQFLTQPDKVKNLTLVIIGPQKGLAGALVANLSRHISQFFEKSSKQGNFENLIFTDEAIVSPKLDPNLSVSLISVQKKGKDISLLYKKPLLADFENLGRQPTVSALRPIADLLVKMFKENQTDLILVAYTHFVNTVTQKAVVKQFLPVLPKVQNEEKSLGQIILFEPDANAILESLMVRYAEGLLYQIALESLASEHSARMVAMKNAHDNAQDIISNLTLSYNKARQNAITSELADIVSSQLA